ncbi:hypothetical protein PILCRDRAFT_811871 [Piloderma croceum F 1598]|uniref:J domain-containing protein n=1 Tax=Piloderma croceum (strain F 1598) TaxID=765440 RepID=A0A0C3CKF4_PILCF|nr:hypothetical protein PILCRDRAFT_811871 [Piloderma croceum F 1598]
MTNKKNKQAKKKQAAANGTASASTTNGIDPKTPEPMNVDSPSPAPSTSKTSPPEIPSPPPETDAQKLTRADRIKEQGNTAFKAMKFDQAIEFYSKAIEIRPEPAYLTNRAASYMGIKKFRPALEDCQQAAALQSASPAPKTLIRLARCQLATGSPTPALSTLRSVLSIDPTNAAALQLQEKVLELEAHLRNFEGAKRRKEWGMARLALDKCLQGIEGEGGEIPTEWRLWRVELELTRGNLEVANLAANDAMRLEPNSPEVLTLRGLVLFLTGKLPQALQHASSALRLDPGHESAQKLRKRVKDVERLKDEGNLAFKAGRLEDAADTYAEALERIGQNEEEGKGGQIRATLLSNRATTLLKLERHEEALDDTEASLLLYPTSFKALRTRARINLHLEKYDVSVSDFKQAIEQAGIEGTDADVKALRGELRKAEAALKRSKTKDYYKILGIPRDCAEIEIKKAYRRESLKHHPDKGGDEEKFKLVVEAHSVLSDPRRRERYDLGEDEDGMGGMNQMDLTEIFAQFHSGGGFGGFNSGGPRGQTHGFPF